MSLTASPDAAAVCPDQRLEVLFDELAELAGQRNAIGARIVQIVAEVDRDELWGATGARSVAALVAWKAGNDFVIRPVEQAVMPHHRALTLAASCSAILTAESAGSALHVLTSIMMLFLCTSARPQPQPGAPAFC